MPSVLARKPLPKPSPESDPRFRKVMDQLKAGAAKTKAHPPAAKKAAEAAGAAKQETPIPPEGAPAPPNVAAGEGMPAPKTDAEVSLQDSKQETEQQMKDAEVTPTQLQKANDPRFSSVLVAKDSVAKQADAAPAQ